MKRFVKTGIAAAIMSGGLIFAGTTAFGGSSGGAVQLFGTPDNNGGGSVVLTGAVGDFGSTASVNAAGKPDPKGQYKLLTLSKGTILVNTKQRNQDANNSRPLFNLKTCSASDSTTDPVPVVSGTGAYEGMGLPPVQLTLGLNIMPPDQH